MVTTKHHLAASVAQATGLTQAEAKIAINELVEVISEELERGRNIELRRFGTFCVRDRAARPARNPQTGEKIMLAKRAVPALKFAGHVKKLVNLSANRNIS